MYQRILVPIDGSPTATRGLDAAIDLARLSGGAIWILHVLDDLVFATGFEMGATYARDVLPRLKRDGERHLAEARSVPVLLVRSSTVPDDEPTRRESTDDAVGRRSVATAA
jgi:nucleotide-binding universal stress UspA family protein